MSANNQEIATRAFAVEALSVCLKDAVTFAVTAGMDCVANDLKHLQGVVEANMEVEK